MAVGIIYANVAR